MAETAPYGTWRSPISAARIASGSVSLAGPRYGPGGDVIWLEGRPQEGGRYVPVRRDGEGRCTDLTPEGFNVRNRVHEYGGGAWTLVGESLICSSYEDQRLHRVDLHPDGPRAPVAITAEPETPAAVRFADADPAPDTGAIVCVRESHGEGEAVNEIVWIDLTGNAGGTEPVVIATGNDFYAAPRISPDGSRIAWFEWSHPRMPWDGTELWVAELAPGGEVAGARRVAGGPSESIWQPGWSPSGELHWVSDESGWWNLYSEGAGALAPDEAEFGYPHWVFGGSTYAFTGEGEIVCLRVDRADERLCLLRDGRAEPFDLPYTSYGFPSIAVRGRRALFAAAGPSEDRAVIELDLDTGEPRVLHRSSEEAPAPGHVSVPRAIEFATEPDRTAHAFFYPPANADFEAPEGELPPLIVQSHGGPSAHVTAQLDPEILFWTSRGFGVVDVNYGGSTGFGRAYRERLRETWGVTDTADCLAAARHLAAEGAVDGERLAIHGGSAGGYTTLCALVFGSGFAAGASYYGVADAETLARDTHKFESRYLDGLIGPYPEAADLYRERSPIHYVERLRSPVIVFQGLEDEVVPPDQAEQIVAALDANGVPHAYLPFEGEQHGFRQASTIIRCLEAELYFYGRIMGFEPADEIEPVEISHLD
jgi:dipeptidyl aminopeptidase/acylaminoacyl peptidase